MRHGIAFIIVIILAFILLVPLIWWIIHGFSFFESFDVVTSKNAPPTLIESSGSVNSNSSNTGNPTNPNQGGNTNY